MMMMMSECPRTPPKKRKEFKKRVNHYLYDNLNRVLCELYFYCEHESNAVQCSEVLNILSRASLQFHQLSRQLIALSEANMKNTKSISWNVSSLSPSKLIADDHDKSDDAQKESKAKTNKEEKVIKCWADYDSESDLDFDSDDSENTKTDKNGDGYEQYIKCDIIQKESKIDEKEKEKEEIEVEIEIDNKTEKSKEETEEIVAVICKENVDPNILKEKSINVQREKEKQKKKAEEPKTLCPMEEVEKYAQHEPITLVEIMNDQQHNKENPPSEPQSNSNSNQGRNKSRNAHNFPLPFNKMVGINKKSHDRNKKLLYIDPPKWPTTRKKNKKIEKLINKLSSSERNNYRSMNRNEQLRKTELKQEKAEKRRLQLREQQHNKWQVVAAKKKQKREALRKQTEKKILSQKEGLNEKLKSAKLRYEKKMKEKKGKLAKYDIKIKNAKKIKAVEWSQKLENQRKCQEERMKNASQRYKQRISKKTNCSKQKQQKQSVNKQKNAKQKKKENGKISKKVKKVFAEREGKEFENVKFDMDKNAVTETLKFLLLQTSEYILGIKAKREWTVNCHFMELKSCVQSLCAKIKQLKAKNNNNESAEECLLCMLFVDKQCHKSKLNSVSLESSFQSVLKVMDSKQTEHASSTYLLMHLVDALIDLIPMFDSLTMRTQRLLLQTIANATQKNRGFAHYIIRSNSCLYLLHLLVKQLTINQSMEMDSIIHTLTISISSIRDFPDLVDRKVYFFKYLSVLKFFDKMVTLFNKMALEKNFNFLLRILPFIQAATSFNLDCDFGKGADVSVIFEVISSTNCYGLQSLISALVLETNGNNKEDSWKKKRSIPVLRIILHSLQSMNNIARLNLKSFQQIIERMQMEIYHVLSYLLQHLTFHFNQLRKYGNNNNNHLMFNIIRLLLAQTILFVGYCSLQNKKFQECLRWGDEQHLINTLCVLPFDYFTKWQEINILYPTLIACTFENNANCKVLDTILNKKHLIQFIFKTYHKQQCSQKTVNNKAEKNNPYSNAMYNLDKRFPINLWRSAIQFYKQ